MKKMVALILVMVLLGCVLCGCESEKDKIAAVSGHWFALRYYTSDSVTEFLSSMDLYEEEIALLDTSNMTYMENVTINEDKTYSIVVDSQTSMFLAESYIRQVFTALFENRDQLTTVYGEEIAAMSEEEFQQFYADLYAEASFEELVALFVGDEEAYVYDEEHGTFRIDGNKLYCTVNGTSSEEYIEYEVSDDTLKLKYTDETVTYSKYE